MERFFAAIIAGCAIASLAMLLSCGTIGAELESGECVSSSACGELLIPQVEAQHDARAAVDAFDIRFEQIGATRDDLWQSFGTVGSAASTARSPGGYAFCAAHDVRIDDLSALREDPERLAAGSSHPVEDAPARCGNELETLSWRLANCERVTHGMEPLGCDLRLVELAREHSDDMRRQRYFEHQGLDGRTPFDRITDASLSYLGAGENLARFAPSSNVAEAAHFGWMDSASHRNNILSEGFDHLGVGVSTNATWVHFGQLFLRPSDTETMAGGS